MNSVRLHKAPQLLLTSLTTAAALWSPQAFALSCDDIMNMVSVNVPENIIVMTVKDSGEQFTNDEVRCLTERGAPAGVIKQAKAMTASEPEVGPTVGPAESKGSALDEEDDAIGSRVDRTKAKALADEGEGSDADEPEKLREAVKQYRAKKPLAASLLLFELIEAGNTDPKHETKIDYYMARSLESLEMWHTSQYHYMKVVKKGPQDPYFNYALPKLVKIARYTGDDTELSRIVTKIPTDAFPSGAQSEMFYLLGVQAFEEDDLSKARKFFGQVSTKSPLFLKSEYFRGVIYNQQNKLKSAVRSFRDVYRAEAEVTNDPRYLKEVEEVKDLALINVARIYYGIDRYDEAGNYYELVNRESSYWAQSVFEHGWANFMQNNLNDTLGQLLTVRSGFFKDDEFLPEQPILRALTYFNLCEYNRVEKLLLGFEQNYRPLLAEMQDFTTQYASEEGKKLADQAWDTYFGPEKKTQSLLPKSLFNKILRNQELNGLVRHLEVMDQETALIGRQQERWADAMTPYLSKILEKDRERYKRRAGLLLLKEMVRQSNKLADLMTQSEIIRFEVVDAQRVDYAYKSQNAEIGDALDTVNIDFATAVEFIYWPFNGEFWKDELGYYHYTEQGSCK
jgi:tetratricopeptide (TPR) repeat protein